MQDLGVMIGIRWRDLDHLGHVYHGEYITILDEARTQWLEETVGLSQADEYVVVGMELDFRAPITRDDKAIHVSPRVERIGNTSITLKEHMNSHVHGTLAVVATTTIVLWDVSNRQPRELTSQDRELLSANMKGKE